VPGPVTSDTSAGCHTIIRQWRGELVTSAADVIETLDGATDITEMLAGPNTGFPGQPQSP